jgi:HK97 family phage prohead protease
MKIEYRVIPIGEGAEVRTETTGDEVRLNGYATVYDKETELFPGFLEKFAPGAFRDALAGGGDVVALYNHDKNLLLGRTKSKTLRLREDPQGLYMEVDLPKTQLGRDMEVLVGRGDIRGQSFGFSVDQPNGETFDKRGKNIVRTVLKASLRDVGPVTFPAYPQTSVSLRSALEECGVEQVEIERILQEQETQPDRAAGPSLELLTRRLALRRREMFLSGAAR